MIRGGTRSVEGPLIFLGWIRSSLLSVLRSLGGRGGRKIILSWGTDPVLCASRYVDEFVAFPGDEGDEGVWGRLLELGRRHPGGLVFPLDDRATRMLLERRDRFPEWLRLPPLPALEIHARATSKAGFAGILGEAGLAHPATLTGSREALLAGVRAGFPFPVLLKPVGRLGGQGIRRVLGLRGPRMRPSETDLRYVLRDPMPAVRAASIKYLGVSRA